MKPDQKKRASGIGSVRVFPFLQVLGGILLSVCLMLLAGDLSGPGSVVMYVATWIVFLHVCIGEYVLVRHLYAVSRNQRALDVLAFVLMFGGILSFNTPALWCAFFAGVFALAIIKYLLIESSTSLEPLQRYAREKIMWESPAVILFAILALVFNRLPPQSPSVQAVETGILLAAALFALWMISVRHIYRRVAGISGTKSEKQNPV